MKKIIFFLLIVSRLQAQTLDSTGTWAFLPASTGNYNQFNAYNVTGYLVSVNWADVKPTAAGAYNFSQMTLMIDSAVARNKFVGIITYVGQNSPTWLFDSVGSFPTYGTAQSGPYPDYYNPKCSTFVYQYYRDFATYLNSLTTTEKHHVLFWQLTEGSTGDEQPYKGFLAPCQTTNSCTITDTVNYPALANPYVPQNKFESRWGTYREILWDTTLYSSEFGLIKNIISPLLNAGNDGSEIDFTNGDSAEALNIYFIESNFPNWPLPIMIKAGQLSHIAPFWGELQYMLARDSLISRGEIQGPLLTTTPYALQDLFTLVCSALTGGLKIFNITAGWANIVTGGTPTGPTDFFTTYAHSVSQGFSVPCFKVDATDSILYPVSIYGSVIDSTRLIQFQHACYSYYVQAAATNFNLAYVNWEIQRVYNKFVSPTRQAKIGALYPTATIGNQTDSMHQNDYINGATYEYHRYLTFTNLASSIVPRFRVGPTGGMYGRFAASPLLSGNMCTWRYDIDNSLMLTPSSDSIEVDITYLDNNSGGSISVSCLQCGQKVGYGVPTTISTNTGAWLTKTVIIPSFRWQPNGYDFMIDFTGGPNTTIGLVTVKNLSKH